MRRFFIFSTILLSVTLFSLTATAQLPPLIDREIFFDNPENAGAQLTPTASVDRKIFDLREIEFRYDVVSTVLK